MRCFVKDPGPGGTGVLASLPDVALMVKCFVCGTIDVGRLRFCRPRNVSGLHLTIP